MISHSVDIGLPVPAFTSSLAYYDGYRRERGPASLIQGLRDLHQTLLDSIVDVALEALALPIDGLHDAGEVADVGMYAVAGTGTVPVVARRRPDVCRSRLVWAHRGPTSWNPALDHGSRCVREKCSAKFAEDHRRRFRTGLIARPSGVEGKAPSHRAPYRPACAGAPLVNRVSALWKAVEARRSVLTT